MKPIYAKAWMLLIPLLLAFSPCDSLTGKDSPKEEPKESAVKDTTPKPSIALAKNSFTPGESVTVQYVALPSYAENAWIGIIPSNVSHGSESQNDQHDISYQYLKKSTSGSMTFRAPNQPGTYDFRMHDTDNNGIEVASVTFTVEGDPAAPQPTGFVVGDAVMVEWKGRWWPARVISLRNGTTPYKIHYDGYSNSWDEWIGDARIRKR